MRVWREWDQAESHYKTWLERRRVNQVWEQGQGEVRSQKVVKVPEYGKKENLIR